MTMRVGRKIYSTDVNHVEALSFADFIEVLVVPDVDWKPLKDFDVEYKVHAAHKGFGVNLADPRKEKLNRKAIDQAVKAALDLDSETVVIHPSGDLNEGSVEQAYKLLSEFVRKYRDVKLLLENLPLFPSDRRLCALPSDFPQFLEMGYGLCLDFGHLVAVAAHNNLDYKKLTQEFLKLKPHYFHVSNGLTRSEADLHMPLNEGDFDLEYFREVVLSEEPAEVVLETPYNPKLNYEEYKAFKEGVFV